MAIEIGRSLTVGSSLTNFWLARTISATSTPVRRYSVAPMLSDAKLALALVMVLWPNTLDKRDQWRFGQFCGCGTHLVRQSYILVFEYFDRVLV